MKKCGKTAPVGMFRVIRRAALTLVGVRVIVAGARLAVSAWRRHRLMTREYEPAPAGMVFVPAGSFLIGSNDPGADPDEKPVRRVFAPAFYLDRFEVTNRQYKQVFPSHLYPEGEGDLPVTGVRKSDAEAYCRAVDAVPRLRRESSESAACPDVEGAR